MEKRSRAAPGRGRDPAGYTPSMGAGVQVSKKVLLISSASNVVRRLLGISVLFWMHRKLLEDIPLEEYKLLPVLMAVIGLTPILTTVLSGGLGRYLTEAYAKGDERRVTEIVSSMSPFLWAAAGALLAVGLVFAWNIDTFVGIDDPARVDTARQMFAVLLVGAVVRVAVAPYVLGFFIRQKFVQRDLIGTSAELLRMLILVVLLTQVSTDVRWVAVAAVSSGLIEITAVFVLSRRLIPALAFRASAVRRETLGPVLSYGSWTILGQLSTIIREVADPLILNTYSSAAQVTAFHTGATADRQLRRTIFSATSIAQPAATSMVATGQLDRLRNAWFRMSRYTLWLMMAATLPLIVFRAEFFQLWLPETAADIPEAQWVLALLLARYIAIFPNATTGMVTMAKAQMRPAATRALALELGNLALTLTLVAGFGMGAMGAALSTFTISIIGYPLLIWTLGLRMVETTFRRWRSATLSTPCCCTIVWYFLPTTSSKPCQYRFM